MNLLHNAVHILFGLWGLAASRSLGGAVTYARGVAIIYAVLTSPASCRASYRSAWSRSTATTSGCTPLLALVAAYFGWVHRNVPPRLNPAMRDGPAAPRRRAFISSQTVRQPSNPSIEKPRSLQYPSIGFRERAS